MKHLILIVPALLFVIGIYYNKPMIYTIPFAIFALSLGIISVIDEENI